MIIMDSAAPLKRFLALTGLQDTALAMVQRMVVAFMLHSGRMTCSSAAGSLASQPVHRAQITRFLARRRWQRDDFNEPLRNVLLQLESRDGQFMFIIDATLVSQSGKLTQNTFSTGNRQRRPKQGRRYNHKKNARKNCHSFTCGLLITPSGIRIPFQIPHYTKEYCERKGIVHRTTAQAAADLIRSLPLPEEAEVVVLGDTAYDAEAVQQACAERGYTWIVPANPERVYQGAKGCRPRLRARLKDWKRLSLSTVRLHFATGPYADYRRLSRWRMGPKQKPRVYYAHQETAEVRSVGRVRLVFSTKQQHLTTATPDDVKILMTNDLTLSLREVIELYSLRWQIELFFKELKSTLGFDQYRFQSFQAVEAWVNLAFTTVLYLEHQRAKHLADRRLSEERKRWWRSQRLHGLCAAFRQESEANELKYISDRLKTPGGIAKLQRALAAAFPKEYRMAQ